MLCPRYHVVLANPPYMKSDNFSDELREGLSSQYKVSRSDLFAIFIERSIQFPQRGGFLAMVTMQTWMFKHSYLALRDVVNVWMRSEGVLMVWAGHGSINLRSRRRDGSNRSSRVSATS
jgi:hypothetical protein